MKDRSIDNLWRYRFCCRYWRNEENTHTFIVAIYTHYLANSLSPELPAVLMCNNIQTFAYYAFLLFVIQKRDRAHAEVIQHEQHESPV